MEDMEDEDPPVPDVPELRALPAHLANSDPAFVDQHGNEWAVNRVATNDINDLCENCGADIKRKPFSMFLWNHADLRCSDCVRFVDGAVPISILQAGRTPS